MWQPTPTVEVPRLAWGLYLGLYREGRASALGNLTASFVKRALHPPPSPGPHGGACRGFSDNQFWGRRTGCSGHSDPRLGL